MIIKWIAGVFLIIGAILFFPVSFWAFLAWLVAGIFCFTPVFTIIEQKGGIRVAKSAKYCIVIGFVILGAYILTDNEKYKKVEKEIAIEKEKKRKEQAIKEANADIDNAIKAEDLKKEIGHALENLDKIGSINTLCVGAITEEGYDEMMTLINVKDEMGLDNLIENGYALQLTKNTKVKIIKTGIAVQQVRILSGEHKGLAVYLPAIVISHNQ